MERWARRASTFRSLAVGGAVEEGGMRGFQGAGALGGGAAGDGGDEGEVSYLFKVHCPRGLAEDGLSPVSRGDVPDLEKEMRGGVPKSSNVRRSRVGGDALHMAPERRQGGDEGRFFYGRWCSTSPRRSRSFSRWWSWREFARAERHAEHGPRGARSLDVVGAEVYAAETRGVAEDDARPSSAEGVDVGRWRRVSASSRTSS